ncbi:hypothetical protein Y032_0706g1695 [Ancylostoma ceylanicum]|uniref:Uncharacterized protein n=1 Tax=Ancylostoma ceylanicum TaxID=53326 RepID=A0A016WG76_9BILA|nr:hypothetical protein Y032_0706g1695 [Ancylostoma ceylanicum]
MVLPNFSQGGHLHAVVAHVFAPDGEAVESSRPVEYEHCSSWICTEKVEGEAEKSRILTGTERVVLGRLTWLHMLKKRTCRKQRTVPPCGAQNGLYLTTTCGFTNRRGPPWVQTGGGEPSPSI